MEKIISIFKNKELMNKICIGVLCFFIGIGAGGSGTVTETEYNDIKIGHEEVVTELEKIKGENEKLEAKVLEAKPWFDMKEEERKSESEKLAKEKEEKEAKEKEEAEAKKKAELDAKKKKLSNGKYEVGIDFEPGKYNITAVAGGGNVICMGAINAIMGPADDGFYQKQYNNITFKKGQVLDIRDVTIELVPVE